MQMKKFDLSQIALCGPGNNLQQQDNFAVFTLI